MVSSANGRYTFTSAAPDIASLKRDDIIIAAFPDEGISFLRRVRTLNKENGLWVVDTGSASLEDVIEEGNRSVKILITEGTTVQREFTTGESKLSTIRQRLSAPCTPLKKKDIPKDIFRPSLAGEGGVTFEFVNSSMDFSIEADLNMKFGLGLKHFRFALTGKPHFDLFVKVTSATSAKIFKEVDIIQCTAPFKVSFGIVPVVGDISFSVKLGAELTLGGAVSTTVGIQGRDTIEIGAEYLSKNWSPIANIDRKIIVPDPEFSADADIYLKAYLKPEAKLTFYGVAGPSLDWEFYLKANRKLVPEKSWQIIGGTAIHARFEVEILSYLLASFEKTLFQKEGILLQSPHCPGSCPTCQSCQDGICKPAQEGKSCNEGGSPCMEGTCRQGICQNSPRKDGISCGTGQICQQGQCVASGCSPSCSECQTCVQGTCQAKADDVKCTDDQNSCTLDICKGGKCTHPNASDGISCGQGQMCQSGRCVASQCSPACGECQTCVQGKCQAKANGLGCTDDNNDCTADTCVAGHCQHTHLSDGTSCGSGKTCQQGQCITSCAGLNCTPCQKCSGNSCVSDTSANNKSCGVDRVCQNGQCIDPCANVSCPVCQKCSNGTCVADFAKNNQNCGGSKVCQSGQCIEPCASVNCQECQKCSSGTCVSDSAKEGQSCGTNATCKQGTCVTTSPCAGVTCPDCQSCTSGSCFADAKFDGQSCDIGKICRSGSCVDPCTGVSCQACERCSGGTCVADSNKNGQSCGSNKICVGGQCQSVCSNCSFNCTGSQCCGASGEICCPNSVCATSQLVCKRNGRCEPDTAPTMKSYRFVNLCNSAHWQSTVGFCYPSPKGATEGCSGCQKSTTNPNCSTTTCWKREISFYVYQQDPGYGSFFQIAHCFEQGANRYSRTGCTTYGEPAYLGWIASQPIQPWDRPVYLCEWTAGNVKEHLFVMAISECTTVNGQIVSPSPFGYVVP